MMKAVIIIIAIIASSILSSCSCTIEEPKPFGTDFSSVLKEAELEPMTDDFIVQCHPQTVNIFNIDGTIERSIEAAIFLSVQSFNTQGLSLQNNVCYLFENAADAEAYYDYASQGIYSVSYDNVRTVRLELETNTYKQDVIQMLDKFDPNITFISKPYLLKEQVDFQVPEHTIEKCK